MLMICQKEIPGLLVAIKTRFRYPINIGHTQPSQTQKDKFLINPAASAFESVKRDNFQFLYLTLDPTH